MIVERYASMEDFMDESFFRIVLDIPTRIQVELWILKFLYQNSLVIFIIISEYSGVFVFFKHKMKPAIASMHSAIGYMKLRDLSHEQNYFDRDEVGTICDELEMLRRQMIAAKHQEWEAQSEQSSINAAFAHDMRTPLTVMKGYTEFLLKYQPEGKVSEEALLEKLGIMHQHQERLLEFSKTMTEIQNMEMRQLHCMPIIYVELLAHIHGTVEELGKQSGKRIVYQVQNISVEATGEIGIGENDKKVSHEEEWRDVTRQDLEISVDENLIMEVCENLISNGLRYAMEEISVCVMLGDHRLQVYVRDDGTGFSHKALREAKSLYYSEEQGTSHHFGMGLYIAEKLCQKHGGTLEIINSTKGGAVCAAEFQVFYK